jgi:Cof subfamily protein (haloacid dehalogenase superfamily)
LQLFSNEPIIMSKQFKAIFLDIDGTLLTSQRNISPGTKEILTRLHNEGLLISVVTARSPDATLLVFNELGMPDNPIICFNGGLIIKNDTIISDISIKAETVHKIRTALQPFRLTTTLYCNRDWFVETVDAMVQRESDVTKTKINITDFNRHPVNGYSVHKILCMGQPEEIKAAQDFLSNSEAFDVNVNSSKATYLEIVHKDASKMQGIQRVMNTYNIQLDEIITIGDNYNDIDMLSFATTSIAMGNAPDAVKKHASMVTDTNNNEGIQKALEKLFA